MKAPRCPVHRSVSMQEIPCWQRGITAEDPEAHRFAFKCPVAACYRVVSVTQTVTHPKLIGRPSRGRWRALPITATAAGDV